jgi:ABC-type transport system involved in multi-copper enzyme maturation permease subunit
VSRRLEAIAAIAWADVLERVRRYSFLVTLAFVLWLGAGTFDGTVSVSIGRTQGAINAAWVGGMMTVVATSFLSLIGFWIVKNAVVRDERTGVGAILATTPLSRIEYTLGKAASHFLVLGAMVAILALCGIALLLTQGGGANGTGGGLDLVAFLGPFLVCGVPAFALIAALAILFETTPGLRGGAANALWLFGWTGLIMLSAEAKSPLLDPFGILIVQKSMAAQGTAQLNQHPSSIGKAGHRFGVS